MLTGSEPQLFVADVAASCAFFTTKLGFAVAFVHGEPPFYGQVVRDDARLNLRMVHQPVYNGDIRERKQLLSASITVRRAADIAKLFAEIESAGVTFHRSVKHEPWGATTFVVVDPDADLLVFAGPE